MEISLSFVCDFFVVFELALLVLELQVLEFFLIFYTFFFALADVFFILKLDAFDRLLVLISLNFHGLDNLTLILELIFSFQALDFQLLEICSQGLKLFGQLLLVLF